MRDVGKVFSVAFTRETANLVLDFTDREYELILYSAVTDESDTNRTFSFSISKSGISSKTAAMTPVRFPKSKNLRPTSRRPSTRPSGQTPPLNSSRTFVFNAFGKVKTDQTIRAKLVAVSNRALAYVDRNLPNSITLDTRTIQAEIDQFSRHTFSTITSAFGNPSDVDQNGRITFLFTHVVDRVGGLGGLFSSVSRLFLSGSKLNTSVSYTYNKLASTTTRVMPPPHEHK